MERKIGLQRTRNIICQFVQSRLQGDHILKAMYSKNLEIFGIKSGKTSFSASYIIGLLLAKKVLRQNFFFQEKNENKQAIPNAVLDLGLRRVTTGNKVFGVMTGVVDGGINVPHNEKRFPGYQAGEKFDSDLLNQRIKGEHVREYMQLLKEEDNEKYQKHFSKLIKNKMEGKNYLRVFDHVYKKIDEGI
mmetsp:Transcript_54861/g.129405  ORF Transcript_54861/g.129405 Transcript_54861/m.129405 type:complete len:189 (-) Transcript_54861:409-975(-)